MFSQYHTTRLVLKFDVQQLLFYGIIKIMQKQELKPEYFLEHPGADQENVLRSSPQVRQITSTVSQTGMAQCAGLRSAVFLDRDGTINAEQGYLREPQAVRLLPTVCEALTLLNALNIPVIVVTNQSALGRGLMSEVEFDAVNTALWQALQACHVHYDALYYCPHPPDLVPPCACRKPCPGLLLQAAADLNLDLSRSYMIGDKQSDLDAGYAAGCHTILVRTGFGEITYKALVQQPRQPDCVAATLLEAAQWVARDRQMAT